jgi:hypothetical protein
MVATVVKADVSGKAFNFVHSGPDENKDGQFCSTGGGLNLGIG